MQCYALRTFRRNPGFATVAVVSLALGIGANTALFEVVNAVSLTPLPVHDPSALVEVRIVDDTGARGNFQAWHPAVTYPIWDAIRTRQQALSGAFAWGADHPRARRRARPAMTDPRHRALADRWWTMTIAQQLGNIGSGISRAGELRYRFRADWRTTTPPFITNTTRRTAVMSSSRLPSVATRSAS